MEDVSVWYKQSPTQYLSQYKDTILPAQETPL